MKEEFDIAAPFDVDQKEAKVRPSATQNTLINHKYYIKSSKSPSGWAFMGQALEVKPSNVKDVPFSDNLAVPLGSGDTLNVKSEAGADGKVEIDANLDEKTVFKRMGASFERQTFVVQFLIVSAAVLSGIFLILLGFVLGSSWRPSFLHTKKRYSYKQVYDFKEPLMENTKSV